VEAAPVGGELPGLLAYAGDEPIGWVAVEPRSRFRRLAISRNLPVVDERPTWSIPCFFVARGRGGRGVSRRLLAAEVARRARTRPVVKKELGRSRAR
jgi:GNAT superfamily N-acetyltransferase